jgi:NAD(P)-dependent dehydrogenase (short-subunit alcohol dehydrogenase family)
LPARLSGGARVVRVLRVGATIDASKLLRPGLLDGVRVLVAGPASLAPNEAAGASAEHAPLADAVASACAQRGAVVSRWRAPEPVKEQVDLLVVDAGATFARVSAGDHTGDEQALAAASREALRLCLDGAWEASRAVANAAFIDAGRPGRIVYLAPAPGPTSSASAGDTAPSVEYADAARAGLENLSRTLSIEWARYGVTLVTIAPGERTSEGEVAALVTYLGSPAGAYFSGCLLDLRGPAA